MAAALLVRVGRSFPTLAAQDSYGDCDESRLDDGRAEREEPDFPFGLGVHIAQRSDAWIVPQNQNPRRAPNGRPNTELFAGLPTAVRRWPGTAGPTLPNPEEAGRVLARAR